MTVRKFGRRWMLMGGGAAIAIPALPSLLPRGHRAAAQGIPAPRRMVVFTTEHGGIWAPSMYPDQSMASETVPHPLHTTHAGPLTSRVEGGDRVISDVLRAPSDVLTESLVGKMNILRGLDVPFHSGHARHLLGNYGRMSNDGDEFEENRETADQVLARTTLYAGTPRRRFMNFGSRGLSIELIDPSAGPAGGVRPAEEVGMQAIWNSVYVDVAPPDGSEPERPDPINAVFDSYQRLQSGAFGAGARLGAQDRQRLNRYMDRLNDIRAALSSSVGVQCSELSDRSGLPRDAYASMYTPDNAIAINDIIMAGFMCDSSRLAVVRVDNPWTDAMESDGGYHEVAHNAASLESGTPERLHGLLVEGKRNWFAQAFMQLISRLDTIPEGEGTMLDNTLVWWGQEAGPVTHHGDNIPIITFGSAGGRFNTGRYFDFRNRDVDPLVPMYASEAERNSNQQRRVGVSLFQWTTTDLDAFDVPRRAWQLPGRSAFTGTIPLQPWYYYQYDQGAMDRSCESPLPGLLRS